MQFKKWKIVKENELLSKQLKEHFEGFKEVLKEKVNKLQNIKIKDPKNGDKGWIAR